MLFECVILLECTARNWCRVIVIVNFWFQKKRLRTAFMLFAVFAPPPNDICRYQIDRFMHYVLHTVSKQADQRDYETMQFEHTGSLYEYYRRYKYAYTLGVWIAQWVQKLGYGMGSRGIRIRLLAVERDFCLFHSFYTASYPRGTEKPFPGAKLPGREDCYFWPTFPK
jgi:hypothetical protein